MKIDMIIMVLWYLLICGEWVYIFSRGFLDHIQEEFMDWLVKLWHSAPFTTKK
jgi:hypothetical protein